MVIGVPREIKDQEYRVGMVPSGAARLAAEGHEVVVEAGAGAGSGIADDEYRSAGARVLPDAASVWRDSDLIVKVKEPLPSEYGHMRRGQILFAYLHLAPLPVLTDALLSRGVRSVGYETIRLPDGSLPLLAPMSQVAGRLAVQIGAAYLQKEHGGKGILLGGADGARRGRVAILGAGTVGVNAAGIGCGLGAEVTVLDVDTRRLSRIEELTGGRAATLLSNPPNIRDAAASCDLLVGAVLVAGACAPRLVTREVLRGMEKGGVLVDVSIDQGGVSETSRPTSHSNPIYEEEGIIHYCVPNIPGSVPRTSTWALTSATLPYCRRLAAGRLEAVLREDTALSSGVNTWDGLLTCRPVAEAQGREWTPLEKVLERKNKTKTET